MPKRQGLTTQGSLLHETAKYCIDTNVLISFFKQTDDENYGIDVFPQHWNFIENRISKGQIVAPVKVREELESWTQRIPSLSAWLKQHNYMFINPTDEQLNLAKTIIKKYPVYAQVENYVGDLMVIALSGVMKITPLTLESKVVNGGKKRPKIPNVCDEFNIKCISVPGFLREEEFSTQ